MSSEEKVEIPKTNPPDGGSLPPSPPSTIPPPAPARSSVVPNPQDDHPVMRAAKWMGAFVGIGGGITAAVVGLWQVGNLIDDLHDAREDLVELRASFDDFQDDAERRDEIQTEILNNLRIAVAAIQAANDARGSSASSTPTRHRTPRVPRPTGGGGGSSSSSAYTPTSASPLDDPSGGITMSRRPPFFPPPTPEPSVDDLMRSLPPLPEDAPAPGEEVAIHADETADIALERAEILQEHL